MTTALYPAARETNFASEHRFTLGDLVARVKSAARANNVESVRTTLEESIHEHPGFLPAELLKPKPGAYARREIYSEPNGRFSIFAMVWAPGQGTLLHDHGGLWVVEAVYQGLIKVQNFQHLGENNGLHQFRLAEERIDGRGTSDRRLPPEEHHALTNVSSMPAVTLHVFGGKLKECNVFEPQEGGHLKVQKIMLPD